MALKGQFTVKVMTNEQNGFTFSSASQAAKFAQIVQGLAQYQYRTISGNQEHVVRGLPCNVVMQGVDANGNPSGEAIEVETFLDEVRRRATRGRGAKSETTSTKGKATDSITK